MDITGKIRRVGKIEAKTNNFCKRKVVLEYKEKSSTITQVAEFELKNGNVEAIDGFSEGDMIKVHFNVRGREVSGKDGSLVVYNSLDVWRIEPAEDPLKTKRATSTNGKIKRANADLPF